MQTSSGGIDVVSLPGVFSHGRLDEGVNLLSKPYTRADLLRKTQQLLTEAQGQVG